MYAFLGNTVNNDKAVAVLAGFIPILGTIFTLYVPLLGAFLLMISSNSGVYGASRIAYSMGNLGLLPSIFQVTHPKMRTPVFSIVVFSVRRDRGTGRAFLQGDQALNFLADLYAFGAALSYTLVFVALITLRFTDRAAPRPYKSPGNVPLTVNGHKGTLSIVSVFGLFGIFAILIFTLLTHPVGRIAGPSWVIFGILVYALYRKHAGRPIFGSTDHEWPKRQKQILAKAGELEMLDQYRAALKAEAKTDTPG